MGKIGVWKKYLGVIVVAGLLMSSAGCGGSSQPNASTDNKSNPPQQTQEVVKPKIDLAAIIGLTYDQVVNKLGKPAAEETSNKYITPKWKLNGFEIEVAFDKNSKNFYAVTVTPIEKYIFSDNKSKDQSERLLKELNISAKFDRYSSAKNIFIYDHNSAQYEVAVFAKDLKAVNEGKDSEINYVYIKSK